MTIIVQTASFEKFSESELEEWRGIPAAIAGDCMNRQQIMAERLRPIADGMEITGQARTVEAFEGDNSAIHAVLSMAEPGDVLVINAGGWVNRGLWGGISSAISMKKGVIGVVLDGAVRDINDLRKAGVPIFAAGVNPAGPSKGGGGVIDGPITCGDIGVHPGDLIRADEDGIAVIPYKQHEQVLSAAKELLAAEEQAMKLAQSGEDVTKIFDVSDIKKA